MPVRMIVTELYRILFATSSSFFLTAKSSFKTVSKLVLYAIKKLICLIENPHSALVEDEDLILPLK